MTTDVIQIVAAGGALVAAGVAAYLVRGSTALPAAVWAVAAAAVFLWGAAARAMGDAFDPAGAAVVRLIATALAVCPTMSLLGAKRPQHGVWQFIVGTLAFVLALPALSALLVRPGSLPDVHLLERCFVAVLLVVGWMNFVGTRHGLAATCISLGLAGLARGVLPWGDPGQGGDAGVDAIAASLVAAGSLMAVCQSIWSPAKTSAGDPALAAIERPFLALRETLGAAWTLRIAERFNAVATERGWPCRLRFAGLAVGQRDGPNGWERDAIRCCRALLRRFVSPAWLERHGGFDGGEASGASSSKAHAGLPSDQTVAPARAGC